MNALDDIEYVAMTETNNNTASLGSCCVDEWNVEIVTFSDHQIDYFIDMLIPILCYESSSFQKRKLIY
jgi:hypothetical protein